MEWKVWGDAKDPLLTGTKVECKLFVEDSTPNDDLYIKGPSGEEEVYENGRWQPV